MSNSSSLISADGDPLIKLTADDAASVVDGDLPDGVGPEIGNPDGDTALGGLDLDDLVWVRGVLAIDVPKQGRVVEREDNGGGLEVDREEARGI